MDARTKLAYAYQILAKLKMDDHTYTHLSARHQDKDAYHIYPFGLRFYEVTAENLLTVNFAGEVIDGEEYQYNKTGYIIHSEIYQHRPDVQAIFHLHTPATVAVSSLEEGLLPLSQWALHFYNRLAYHDYNSLALDAKTHGNAMVQDLGHHSVLFLRNHGFIACGKTVEEAMFYCHHLELACQTQVQMLSMKRPILQPSEDICQQTNHDLLTFEKNLGERDWHAWVRWVSS